MKKIICLLTLIIFMTGCTSKSEQKTYTKEDIINYALGQQVSDFLTVQKASFIKCPMDSQKYNCCIARLYKNITKDQISISNNIYIDRTTKQKFIFNLNGSCLNNNECSITYILKDGKSIEVPVKNIDGYLVTSKKYSNKEFKQMVDLLKKQQN